MSSESDSKKAGKEVSGQIDNEITHQLTVLTTQRLAAAPSPDDVTTTLSDFASWRAQFEADYGTLRTLLPVQMAFEKIDTMQARLQLTTDLRDLRAKGKSLSFENLAAVTEIAADPTPEVAKEAQAIRTQLLATLGHRLIMPQPDAD